LNHLCVTLDTLEDVLHVVIPFHACIRHSKVNFGIFTRFWILCFFSYFHRSVKMFCACVKITLLS
jgi:hypothetical protein